MKIEYDETLYRDIANYRVNDVVLVSNRKGKRSTIQIKKITSLTWHELQLLVSEGADRFTKMVLLYRRYAGSENNSASAFNGARLTPAEVHEIDKYIEIFRSNGCTEHHQVNEIVSQNSDWDQFPTIRSLNDHGEYRSIEGIQPKYFEIVCSILEISGGPGRALDSYKPY